jgi:hypothetical protein
MATVIGAPSLCAHKTSNEGEPHPQEDVACLARKTLIAMRRCVTTGELLAGTALKPATT